MENDNELNNLPQVVFESDLPHKFENFPRLGDLHYEQGNRYERFTIYGDIVGVEIVENENKFHFIFTQPSNLEINFREPFSENKSLTTESKFLYSRGIASFEYFENGDLKKGDFNEDAKLPLCVNYHSITFHGEPSKFSIDYTYGMLKDIYYAKEYLNSLRALSSILCSIGMVLDSQRVEKPNKEMDSAYNFYINSTRKIFKEIPGIITHIKGIHGNDADI